MYFSNPFTYTELYSRTKVLVLIHNNFQQWMSRLAHRWRTLRTAIRNANCRIQWVIEILNAYCTFGLCLEVCLYQCPYNKLAFLFLCSQGLKWQNVRCLEQSWFRSEIARVPLNVRWILLCLSEVMLELQWSVWIVLHFRRLRLGHMEATSFGGMLGFGPTLQLIVEVFVLSLRFLCCVRLELDVVAACLCFVNLRRLRVKRSTPIWDWLLLRQWLIFTLDLISGKTTRWT